MCEPRCQHGGSCVQPGTCSVLDSGLGTAVRTGKEMFLKTRSSVTTVASMCGLVIMFIVILYGMLYFKINADIILHYINSYGYL